MTVTAWASSAVRASTTPSGSRSSNWVCTESAASWIPPRLARAAALVVAVAAALLVLASP